jgi:hypothetical protein
VQAILNIAFPVFGVILAGYLAGRGRTAFSVLTVSALLTGLRVS